jgi:hypothetical protein
MKKQLLILGAALMTLNSISAFGQGVFLFTANKNSVFDNFTTQGASVSGGGHTIAGFIWGAPGTSNTVLGAVGNPVSNTAGVPSSMWSFLSDPNFHLATNSTSGALVTQPVNASGLQIGGIGYLAGSTFTVLGTVGGNTYTLYAVAWNSIYATPQEAAANGSAIGWSNPFQYASGNGPLSTPLGFSGSGMTAFGVSPVPEPTTFALAGLGAAALLIFRRRK